MPWREEKMKSAEAQLREIRLALKYCELDFDEILEDYREHLKDLKRRSTRRAQQGQPVKDMPVGKEKKQSA